MATLTDVARECGVSVSTVSLVINNKGRISGATRNRIMEAMDKVGYDLEAKRAVPAPIQTRTIGLVLPRPMSVNDEFYYRAVTAQYRTTLEYGYDSKILNQADLAGRVIENFYKGKEQLGCEGLILFTPNDGWEALLPNLKAWNVPVAVIRRTTDCEGVVCFTDDDYRGARMAVEHLVDTGHRTIATLTRSQFRTGVTAERLRAWRDVLTERGIEPDNRLDLRDTDSPDELLAKIDTLKVTAVVAIEDALANGLVDALQQSGRRVPEDVAVIGYSDDPIASSRHPRLSTVRIPVEDMVSAACRTLVRWLPENYETQSVMTFKNELIVRESTGTSRNADSAGR